MGETKQKTYYLATLGCPKNEVDSEAIEADLVAAGLIKANDSTSADLVIVNSCGFVNDAKVESIHTVLDLNQDRGKDSVLVLCGCLPARYNLTRSLDEVDIFLPWNKHEELRQRLAEIGWQVGKLPIECKRMPPKTPYGYIRISEGCDNHCAYCAIPAIKGPFVSRPPDEIIEEAEFLSANGVKELILIGQDTTLYGKGLAEPASLGRLLNRLAEFSLDWIRLLYAHPAHLDDEAISAMIQNDRVVKYVDLPLQHINDRLLKKMNRKVTRRHIEKLIEKLRSRIPGIVLRTTFIVGFPGETDLEFAELLEFCEKTEFDNVGIFKYSPEDGTPAYRFRGRLDVETIEERYLTLLDAQNMISAGKQKARLKSKERVLLHGVDGDGKGYARGWFQAPEIDGQIIIENCMADPGGFVDVVIERNDPYDLFARQLNRQSPGGVDGR
ncbi:MAG: ribosomal protein S12 methylthiotransferase RimO [candidate division Zixibacteria bacterium RBG_16_53_22]|nr:MAG: ribosomal protein S12 methylthiotransferase RimO [candidate division Zixibacteria bacterium RBG_16_53_22]